MRSTGGWAAVAALRRGREAYLGDERILGSPEFVEELRREVDKVSLPPTLRLTGEDLVARVCRHVGIAPERLQGGGRSPQIARARTGIAYLWLELLGRAGRPLAPALGVRPQSVYRAAVRGREDGGEWRLLVTQ